MLESLNEAISKFNFNQFNLIEQNPQFSQEHISLNFEIFEKIMKILKSKHEKHVYMMHEQKPIEQI